MKGSYEKMNKYASLAKRIRSRLLTDLSGMTGLNLSKPSYICAKMTMRCNSRCVHCNIWKTDYHEKELTTAQWIKTLDELRNWLGKFLMVFTGGEALLRTDMVDILEYAVRLGIDVELLTNGLIVNEELAGRIVASGIAQITVSMDGSVAGTHDRFRGKDGYYAKTTAAVFALALCRERLKSPLKILLKTVISRNNLAEIAEIARFAELGGYCVRYQPIEQNYGESNNPEWYRRSELWVNDIPKLQEQMTILKELKASGTPIENSVDELDSYVRYFEYPEEMMAAVKAHDIRGWNKACRAALGSFVLSSNGDVRMCYMMEPIGSAAAMGPRELWAKRRRCWKEPCLYR